MEPAVDEHRAVTGRKDETVTIQPLGSGGVKTERFAKKNGAHICATQGEAEVTGGTGVDGIDGQSAGLCGYSC